MSNNYWKKRLLRELNDIANTNTKSILGLLAKLYLESQTNINRELSIMKQTRSVTNNPSSREIILQDTLDRVNNTITVLADNTNNLLTKDLTTNYVQTYETINEYMKPLGYNVLDIIPANVEDIVKSPWTGVSFSDRIWHNKDILIYNAKDIITKGLIRGDSYHTMATQLANTMGSSYSNARRLVETEVMASQSKAKIDNYINNGIEKVEIITSKNEKRKCEHCSKLDGKIVSLKDAIIGKDLPPYHPYCKCTFVGHID